MNIVELAAWIVVLAVGIPVALGILAGIIRILISPAFWVVATLCMIFALVGLAA
jgi:hypothetical protein